jgi:hypothetical protein
MRFASNLTEQQGRVERSVRKIGSAGIIANLRAPGRIRTSGKIRAIGDIYMTGEA